MKLVEAAEAGYAAANSYFLLLWGIVAVVALTTFFEQREISKDWSEAARVIRLYDDLISPTEATASFLNRVVSGGPHYAEPKKLFFEMRANTLLSRALLSELQSTIGARRDLSDDTRVRINTAINPIQAILYFNTHELVDFGMVPISGEQGLLLAEFDVGTMGSADTVEELRVQDAVRYLWLATIPMRKMMSEADELRRQASSIDLVEVDQLAKQLTKFAETSLNRESRDVARDLWLIWIKALPSPYDDPEAQLERLAMERLQLATPSIETIEAFRVQSIAKARQTGSEVEVNLPGFSLPLRLLDALIFMPAVVAVCLLAIYVYTSRGLRYGTRENLGEDHQIVGKTPVYLALYGVSKPIGVLIGAAALGLPVGITVALPLAFVPTALSATWASWVFWSATMFSAAVLVMLLVQMNKVNELIADGVVLTKRSEQGRGLKWRNRTRSQ